MMITAAKTKLMPNRRLAFWFDFASTYAYLSAMRIDAMAALASVEVEWRPFLLGPIFADQGWSTSPFQLYPAKGRYMVRDIGRIAESRNLTFQLPEPFPQNSVQAARVALVGARRGWINDVSKALFQVQFATGKAIDDGAVLGQVLDSLGLDKIEIMEAARSPDIKLQLRAATAEAAALGIFGAPTFITSDGELFWGDDRLPMAVEWAQRF
jgi:2-hydroxychromene-2-carboxylate isomerase